MFIREEGMKFIRITDKRNCEWLINLECISQIQRQQDYQGYYYDVYFADEECLHIDQGNADRIFNEIGCWF